MFNKKNNDFLLAVHAPHVRLLWWFSSDVIAAMLVQDKTEKSLLGIGRYYYAKNEP